PARSAPSVTHNESPTRLASASADHPVRGGRRKPRNRSATMLAHASSKQRSMTTLIIATPSNDRRDRKCAVLLRTSNAKLRARPSADRGRHYSMAGSGCHQEAEGKRATLVGVRAYRA